MRTLGLDLGTNSIGWGIVDEANPNKKIQKCGVLIFPEGVKKGQRVESSKAAERTKFRLARRLKFRRKLRKYETLKVLIANEMCPLTLEELEKWRKGKIYPTNLQYIKWYRTDEKLQWEPYYLRKKCVEQKADKQEIGRALYHLAQRRGFLSNRKETTKSEDGKVKTQISEISEAKGDKTLGQYFYELKVKGERVRGKYTSRKSHYEEEFNKICEVQNINSELKTKLYNAIFFQRKLKSQKFLVGKCTFEPNKPRCPTSHFEFEEFRMLSFINSIKVAKNSDEDDDQDFVFLSKVEKESISSLFYRKSKASFCFEDIAKKLKGKNEYWKFNFRNDTSVSGCPVSAGLLRIFGNDWKTVKIGQYDINDIWHVLFDFDDDEKLKQFAIEKLHLTKEQADSFMKISIQQGYANLSLKAIRNITPFLKEEYLYSHAAFLANIPNMIGKEVFETNKQKILVGVEGIFNTIKDKNNVISVANNCLESVFKDPKHDFHSEEWDKGIVDSQIKDFYGTRRWNEKSVEEQNDIRNLLLQKIEDVLKIATSNNYNDYKYKSYRTDECIRNYLEDNGFSIKKSKKLYHPSDTEYNFEAPKIIDNKKYLGSPRTASVKNPVAMRALFQLKKLVNYLIKTGEIDSNTRIHIELANEVNDKNWRKAIEEFQKANENKNDDYRKAIIQTAKEYDFSIEPTQDDIKKYRLWVEQNRLCPYTGRKIEFSQLFGSNPQFDFEHTVPRSLSFDDSLENLTLCDSSFNRNVKKQQLPSQLANYDEIYNHFSKNYEDAIDRCLSIIERNQTKGRYIDPDRKDTMIVARHKAQLELDYYKGKLKRFSATEITSGFKNSQLNDTRIITKFALAYLKGVFNYVQPVKGSFTDLFKRQWGIMSEKEKKDRSTYQHHAIDALTIACINRGKYNLLSGVIKKSSSGTKLRIEKPWETFDTDVFNAVKYIIPKFYSDDNSLRQTKKVIRDRYGKIVLANRKKQYIQGNTARGSLHRDTFYGCIMTPPVKNKMPKKIFVQSVSIESFFGENKKPLQKAEKIIDKAIKEAFLSNVKNGIQTLDDIKTKGILFQNKKDNRTVYVKKVRVKATVANPIHIKNHQSVSKQEYKQPYYVTNDENYLIALYKGFNAKGKVIRAFKVLNLLDAVHKKQRGELLFEKEIEEKKIVHELYKTAKIGQTLILQENEEEDVLNLPKGQLYERIYCVRGIESDGRIKLTKCRIAEAFSLKKCTTKDEYGDFSRLSAHRIAFLQEGKDFKISQIGEIERI